MDLGAYLEEFDEAEVDASYPNARRFFTGSLFISHAGADQGKISEWVAAPVLRDRFGDGYFLHNRRSGGSRAYKVLVRAALRWCDKFLVILTRNTEKHAWMRAELEWLMQHHKPLIACILEDVQIEDVHPHLSDYLRNQQVPRYSLWVDYRQGLSAAQTELALALDSILAVSPYPRFPDGPP
jgi:hypothetical protein